MPFTYDNMLTFGESFVAFLASFDAFNETVGKEVDEILAERIETEVDRAVENAVDSAVDKAVESHIEDALANWESPLEQRVEELEGFVENFENPQEEIKTLHARLDLQFTMIGELTYQLDQLKIASKPKTRWEKLLAWW